MSPITWILGGNVPAAPEPIVLMSLPLAIPWRVALQQSSPPLHQLMATINRNPFHRNGFSPNGECLLFSVSQDWGPPQHAKCVRHIELQSDY